MEQLKIEKMRKFYDLFPYPNRPFFIAPKLELQLVAHGGFAHFILQGKLDQAKKIRLINSNDYKDKKFLAPSLAKEYTESLEIAFPKDKRILLVGCGTDEPLLFRKLHPENEILAVDLSKNAIHKARKKISFYLFLQSLGWHKKKPQMVEFLVGNAEMVLREKAIGNFDFIQCFGVIHHQPQPYFLLNAMVERLNSFGIIRLMVYSFHGRKLERRIQSRYENIWNLFLKKRIFKSKLFFNYFKLRFWQFFNFFGIFSSTFLRFRYLGPGSTTVADALMHPCDPGIPLTDIYNICVSLGLRLIYCEGKLENEGYLYGFEQPELTWQKIVEGDRKQELLSNPVLIFCKA